MQEKKERQKDPALPWKILSVISLAGFFALLFKGYILSGEREKPSEAVLTAGACSDESVQRVLKFINENLVAPGSKASLINYSSENICWILTEYRGRKIPVILKNENDLVLPYSVLNLEEEERKREMRRKSFEERVNKTETPEVKLFIMSFCPYGRQAMKAMLPVYNLLKNEANFEFHYVIYPSDWYKGREKEYCIGNYCSMHGIKETREDVRELCILKLYGKDSYAEYMEKQLSECSFSNIEECWKEVAREVGIDAEKIENCLNTTAVELLKSEYELNKKLGVSGSPTLFINGVMYTGERTPEAFKNAVCAAFLKKPAECSRSLSSKSSGTPGTCA